jgi:hypothetical protein
LALDTTSNNFDKNRDGNYFDLSEKTSNNILNFKEKVNLITQNI